MIGFLIKKNFFDLWDNILKIALINLGFIVSLLLPVFVPPLLAGVPALGIAALFVGILLCCVYLAAAARCVKRVSDYGSFGFADFFGSLKTAWPAGLVLGGFVALGYTVLTMVLPFYLAMQSIIGLLLAALIFWTFVTAVLSLQFFFAICFRLDSRLPQAIKKCFLIFFDNPAFCVFSLIHSVIALALSALLAFLAPGPGGILLFHDEALRLRLLKYDWLEANPDAGGRIGRRKIPWDALLIDEREKTGTRSFRNFIFPWKD